jgi:hypothetical protein
MRRQETTHRESRSAVAAYIAIWVASAALVAGAAILVLDASEPADVALPPVRATELAAAARDARCELTPARAGQRLNPPVDGPAARPAAPGIYDTPPDTASLVGSMRRGVVVVYVRADVPDGAFEVLENIQKAVPAGTIVVRNDAAMPFQLAMTAYRRLLACPRLTARTFDAVRLFRGRFVGSGPD